MEQQLWFITGVSSGLGQALAQQVINQGQFVIGTFRNAQQAEEFTNQHPNNALGLIVDLTNHTQIEHAVNILKQRFGKIDVLVNNAGYGMAGAVEETSITEARAIFEANFFGTLRLTQALLPMFRAQRKGHIIQISSHGGVKAFAGFGLYNASKFAIEAVSEAMQLELAPLGINLTIVEPGPFRTQFASNGFVLATNLIDDYTDTAGVFRQRIKGVDGKQPGNPTKAAEIIYGIPNLQTPPLRMPLGSVAIGTITAKINSLTADVEQGKTLAAQADF